MIACGVSSSKTTTASTTASAARTSARSASRVDGTLGPLVGADGPVGIHGDDQRVASGGAPREVAHVARMEDVEHAVREDDARTAARPQGVLAPGHRVGPESGRGGGCWTHDSGDRSLKRHPARELPRVARAVDADVLGARLHPEAVEQAVVVVGIAVELVERRRRACRCPPPRSRPSMWNDTVPSPSRRVGLQLLDVRVRAEGADAVEIEECRCRPRSRSRAGCAERRRISTRSPEKNTCAGWPSSPTSSTLGDFDLARAPPALGGLEHVGRRPQLPAGAGAAGLRDSGFGDRAGSSVAIPPCPVPPQRRPCALASVSAMWRSSCFSTSVM